MGINMSYCMVENTKQAMEELLERYMETTHFEEELSPTERKAWHDLLDLCEKFTMVLSEQF